METWSTLEQVIWAELIKVKEQAQEVPNTCTLCGELHENQKSQEKQISVLRSFARRVEQFLAQMRTGAVAPRESMDTQSKEGESSESLGYVPGAPASSSTASAPLRQSPTPPRTPTTQVHSHTGAVAPRTLLDTPTRRSGSGEPSRICAWCFCVKSCCISYHADTYATSHPGTANSHRSLSISEGKCPSVTQEG